METIFSMRRYNSTDHIYIRPLLRWHGGKVKKSRRLIDMIPCHRRFLDVCVGGGSLAFNKPRSKIEILSDINPDLINFYSVVRDFSKELIHLVSITQSTQATFQLARRTEMVDPVHRALAFLIRNRMSFRSFGRNFEPNAHWNDMPRRIERVSWRLRGVQLQCIDLFERLRYARSSTFIFIDPPYLDSHYHIYNFPLQDHIRLLDAVNSSKAKILLTASDSPIYSSRLTRWTATRWSMPVMCGPTRRTITEIAWRNYV